MTDWESYKPLVQLLSGITGILVAYLMFYIDQLEIEKSNEN